ncbi:hypothetical protein H4219_005613 [Mycoemilia scoparia]|uniref:Uncharacterized protein n=1 Tax=Mycoemilia scoparia TaxID=417184 RepID=A0A9W8DNZ0_9FUNG|nr:hypothetical protein H4219_005613 [Mycoemilia scoparia]
MEAFPTFSESATKHKDYNYDHSTFKVSSPDVNNNTTIPMPKNSSNDNASGSLAGTSPPAGLFENNYNSTAVTNNGRHSPGARGRPTVSVSPNNAYAYSLGITTYGDNGSVNNASERNRRLSGRGGGLTTDHYKQSSTMADTDAYKNSTSQSNFSHNNKTTTSPSIPAYNNNNISPTGASRSSRMGYKQNRVLSASYTHESPRAASSDAANLGTMMSPSRIGNSASSNTAGINDNISPLSPRVMGTTTDGGGGGSQRPPIGPAASSELGIRRNVGAYGRPVTSSAQGGSGGHPIIAGRPFSAGGNPNDSSYLKRMASNDTFEYHSSSDDEINLTTNATSYVNRSIIAGKEGSLVRKNSSNRERAATAADIMGMRSGINSNDGIYDGNTSNYGKGDAVTAIVGGNSSGGGQSEYTSHYSTPPSSLNRYSSSSAAAGIVSGRASSAAAVGVVNSRNFSNNSSDAPQWRGRAQTAVIDDVRSDYGGVISSAAAHNNNYSSAASVTGGGSGSERRFSRGTSYLSWRRKQTMSTPDIDSAVDSAFPPPGYSSVPRNRQSAHLDNMMMTMGSNTDPHASASRRIKHNSFIDTRSPLAHNSVHGGHLRNNINTPRQQPPLAPPRVESAMDAGPNRRTPADRIRTNSNLTPYSQRVQELQNSTTNRLGDRNSFATVSSLSNFTIEGDSWMNRQAGASLDDSQMYAHTPARMAALPNPQTAGGITNNTQVDTLLATTNMLDDSPSSIAERMHKFNAAGSSGLMRATTATTTYAQSEAATESAVNRGGLYASSASVRSRANSRALPNDTLSDNGLWSSPRNHRHIHENGYGFSNQQRGYQGGAGGQYESPSAVAAAAMGHMGGLNTGSSAEPPNIITALTGRERRYSFNASNHMTSPNGGVRPMSVSGATNNPGSPLLGSASSVGGVVNRPFAHHRRGNSGSTNPRVQGDVLACTQNRPHVKSPSTTATNHFHQQQYGQSQTVAMNKSSSKQSGGAGGIKSSPETGEENDDANGSTANNNNTAYYDLRAQSQKVQELLQENFDLRLRNKILSDALEETSSDSIKKLAHDYERACKSNRKASEKIKELLEKIQYLTEANDGLIYQVNNPPKCNLVHGMTEDEKRHIQDLEIRVQDFEEKNVDLEEELNRVRQELNVQEESCSQLQKDLMQEKENADNWRQLALQRQQANSSFNSPHGHVSAYRGSPDYRGGDLAGGMNTPPAAYIARSGTGATSETLGNPSEGSEVDWSERSPRHLSTPQQERLLNAPRHKLNSPSFKSNIFTSVHAAREQVEALEKQVAELQNKCKNEHYLYLEVREAHDKLTQDYENLEKIYREDVENYESELNQLRENNSTLQAEHDEIRTKLEELMHVKQEIEQQLRDAEQELEHQRKVSGEDDGPNAARIISPQPSTAPSSRSSQRNNVVSEPTNIGTASENDDGEGYNTTEYHSTSAGGTGDSIALQHMINHLRDELESRNNKICHLENTLSDLNECLNEERALYKVNQELVKSCLQDVVVSPTRLGAVEARLRDLRLAQSMSSMDSALSMYTADEGFDNSSSYDEGEDNDEGEGLDDDRGLQMEGHDFDDDFHNQRHHEQSSLKSPQFEHMKSTAYFDDSIYKPIRASGLQLTTPFSPQPSGSQPSPISIGGGGEANQEVPVDLDHSDPVSPIF